MKKRVLVIIAGQGSVIHIIRTGILKGMLQFCTPVVGILWQQDDLAEELMQQGIEVHILPAYETSAAYKALRNKLNLWYKWYKLKTPSTTIEDSYRTIYFSRRKNFNNRIKKIKERLLFALNPFYLKRLLNREEETIAQLPVYSAYEKWLQNLSVDAIFTVTPFLHEVDLLARIAVKKNIRLLASIHSFDNVTKRGWVAVFFQHYIVWNNYNKAELTRINPALKNNISVAGAPQFDFHYSEKYVIPKEAWLDQLGLPQHKKIILYGSGIWWLFPDETQYVTHLDEAIEAGLMPENTIILLRCHPLDRPERWKPVLQKARHIYFDAPPVTKENPDKDNVTDETIARLISTLKHTDVHINLSSTMAVDGSVFNKPQIGPAYDEIHKSKEHLLQKMYHQEHYVPITNAKAVNLAFSRPDLIEITKSALNNPENYNINCKKCVAEIACNTDGRSAERVVAILKEFFPG